MSLDRLKVFYVVAMEGSLVNAAKKLHIAQPAIGRTIKLLEEELGTRLFDRVSKLGLRLTPQGERVLKFAERVLNEAELFERGIKEEANYPQGELKIITTPIMGETVLASCLFGFLEKYKEIKFKIITQLENIDVQKADIAIRTAIPHQLDIIQLPLKKFHIKLWASQAYLEAHGTPLTAQDLDNHRLLVFEQDNHNVFSNTNWILHAGREKETPRQPFYEINSNEGLYQTALRGYGITQLPIEYIKLRSSKLVQVLPDIESPDIEIYFIYPKRLKNLKKIVVLYDYLRDCLENL